MKRKINNTMNITHKDSIYSARNNTKYGTSKYVLAEKSYECHSKRQYIKNFLHSQSYVDKGQGALKTDKTKSVIKRTTSTIYDNYGTWYNGTLFHGDFKMI